MTEGEEQQGDHVFLVPLAPPGARACGELEHVAMHPNHRSTA
ncbi:MAG: hypothetical protein ABSD97_08470 [Acidimicrobiales bacterium]